MKDSGKLLLYYSPFPFQPSLNYLSNNCDVASLKVGNLILYKVAFLINVSFPLFLAQMWHVMDNFHIFLHVFQECQRPSTPRSHPCHAQKSKPCISLD